MNSVSLENLATLLPITAFLLLLLLQTLAPRRDLYKNGLQRIFHNLFLFVVNSVIMRLLVPASLIMAAVWAEQNQIGLFHSIQFAPWLTGVLAVVLLDFAIYW